MGKRKQRLTFAKAEPGTEAVGRQMWLAGYSAGRMLVMALDQPTPELLRKWMEQDLQEVLAVNCGRAPTQGKEQASGNSEEAKGQ